VRSSITTDLAQPIQGSRNFSRLSRFETAQQDLLQQGRKEMKISIATLAVVGALISFSPASAAKMMPCTGENMAKSLTAASAMPYSPARFAMMKELSEANSAMSKGDMRAACKSYMRAQMISGK
jgi:hypothetical protein